MRRLEARLVTTVLVLMLVGAIGMPGRAASADGFEGSDERFVVFPTYAARTPDGGLLVPVRAWVFEPETSSVSRRVLIGALGRIIDVEDPTDSYRLERRVRPFLVDNERGQTLALVLAGERFTIGESGADGHLERRVKVPPALAAQAVEARARRHWVRARFEAGFGMSRGQDIPVIERDGLSVISDIDDTIKVTNVLDTKAMLESTFLRRFEAVPGMAEWYARIRRDTGAAFHYVSASPWQLLPFLETFLKREGFPGGSYHMRQLRPKSIRSPVSFLSDSRGYKLATIIQLLRDFPGRDFVLIGDSTEHDPEVYGTVARRRPGQISKIHIRPVDGADNTPARFERAFRGVARDRWTILDDGS